MPISKASGQAVAPAAKGDLVVGSATNDAAVLGVGTNGQYLQADSSTTTGLKWATLSVGPTLLSTTNLSGSITTVSSISQTYTNLIVLVENPSVSSLSGGELSFRLNGDSSFIYGRARFGTGSTTLSQNSNENRISSDLTGTLATTNDAQWLFIYDYTNSTRMKYMELQSVIPQTPGNGFGVAYYSSTSAITSVSFRHNDGGNFDAGTIKIYGV